MTNVQLLFLAEDAGYAEKSEAILELSHRLFPREVPFAWLLFFLAVKRAFVVAPMPAGG